jgi:hypothetical protein
VFYSANPYPKLFQHPYRHDNVILYFFLSYEMMEGFVPPTKISAANPYRLPPKLFWSLALISLDDTPQNFDRSRKRRVFCVNFSSCVWTDTPNAVELPFMASRMCRNTCSGRSRFISILHGLRARGQTIICLCIPFSHKSTSEQSIGHAGVLDFNTFSILRANSSFIPTVST